MKLVNFSEQELIDILWAWAAISFAFAVALGGGFAGLGPEFVSNLIVAGVTVGIAFLFHELAHKFLAQKYGCWAEFRKFNFGLLLAVMMSFLGFIIAAPGAVMISGYISKEQNGKISAIGPVINIGLAILFLLAGIFLPQILGAMPPIFNRIIFFGVLINAWLALFNMLPFPPFDGSKVMSWSFPVWLGIAAVAFFLVFFI